LGNVCGGVEEALSAVGAPTTARPVLFRQDLKPRFLNLLPLLHVAPRSQ
jgi:hypothetical protein